jgi:sirohydrochlorin cobaltochelatase
MLRTDSLTLLLEDALAAGFRRIGQVAIIPCGTGWVLCHADDAPDGVDFDPGSATENPLAHLEEFASAFDVARYDDAGNFRPLKSAPNLRRGWKLVLPHRSALAHALDLLYPAALGNWRALLRGDLAPVPLRTTLGRQTGMYRIAATLSDGQAEDIVKSLCGAGCLRRRLWDGTGGSPSDPANAIPLLCGEACNLFVAAARAAVKKKSHAG